MASPALVNVTPWGNTGYFYVDVTAFEVSRGRPVSFKGRPKVVEGRMVPSYIWADRAYGTGEVSEHWCGCPDLPFGNDLGPGWTAVAASGFISTVAQPDLRADGFVVSWHAVAPGRIWARTDQIAKVAPLGPSPEGVSPLTTEQITGDVLTLLARGRIVARGYKREAIEFVVPGPGLLGLEWRLLGFVPFEPECESRLIAAEGMGTSAIRIPPTREQTRSVGLDVREIGGVWCVSSGSAEAVYAHQVRVINPAKASAYLGEPILAEMPHGSSYGAFTNTLPDYLTVSNSDLAGLSLKRGEVTFTKADKVGFIGVAMKCVESIGFQSTQLIGHAYSEKISVFWCPNGARADGFISVTEASEQWAGVDALPKCIAISDLSKMKAAADSYVSRRGEWHNRQFFVRASDCATLPTVSEAKKQRRSVHSQLRRDVLSALGRVPSGFGSKTQSIEAARKALELQDMIDRCEAEDLETAAQRLAGQLRIPIDVIAGALRTTEWLATDPCREVEVVRRMFTVDDFLFECAAEMLARVHSWLPHFAFEVAMREDVVGTLVVREIGGAAAA